MNVLVKAAKQNTGERNMNRQQKLGKLDILDILRPLMAQHEQHQALLSEYQISVLGKLKVTVERIELEMMFDVDIKGVSHPTYHHVHRFNCDISIGLFGEKQGRIISWLDADCPNQPQDEWLYKISFPTGAYIFGQCYPTETFRAFFGELKSFGPKYSDSTNKSLYFTPDKAKAVHDAYASILEKYKGLVDVEIRRKEIAETEAKLAKLKGESTDA